MKKIGKLQINTERILNNQELRTLKGGIDCCCVAGGKWVICGTYGSPENCQSGCASMGYGYEWWG